MPEKLYATGELVNGHEYVIGSRDDEYWRELGYLPEDELPEDMEVSPEDEAEPEQVEDEGPEWPHKMSPENYLARFPEGPDSDLAREIVEG